MFEGVYNFFHEHKALDFSPFVAVMLGMSIFFLHPCSLTLFLKSTHVLCDIKSMVVVNEGSGSESI